MATDPFRLIASNNASLDQQAQTDSNQGQDALMQMFRMEAQRQLPYATMPADIAQANAVGEASLGRQMRLAKYRQELAGDKNSSKWASMPPSDILNIINEESKAGGVDPLAMVTLADIETGGKFNANAQNPNSSAGGLFQFVDDTWNQYGGGGNKGDPRANTIAAVRLARDNASTLEKFGVKPTAGNLYLAHQQGAGTAARLLANPNAPAEQIVGPQAFRLNGGRPGMTAGQFASMWTSKADRIYAQRLALKSRTQQPQQQVVTTGTNGQPLPQIDLSQLDDDDTGV